MKPRIGMPCVLGDDTRVYTLREKYVSAIHAAGGMPLLLPCVEDADVDAVVGMIDGLLIPGGGDIDPEWFGEEPDVENGPVDPVADRYEIALCRAVLAASKPVFGICRGNQVLNVAAGGDLFQDVRAQTESRLQHRQNAPGWHGSHRVRIHKGSMLERIVRVPEFRVNSFHHQAVRRVAPGFRVAATALDGLVEAIEATADNFALGVQWHPEQSVARSEEDRRLFEAFVAASKD